MNWAAVQAAMPVSAATATAAVDRPELAPMTPDVTGPSFGQLVTEGLSKVNGELLTSQADLQQLAVGNVQNLHQIMIRLEESRLSFELMLQVRNRLLEAYQELMKMQV